MGGKFDFLLSLNTPSSPSSLKKMLSKSFVLTTWFLYTALFNSVSAWSSGPGRIGHLGCDAFPKDGLYMLVHMDTQRAISYCYGGCLFKNGAWPPMTWYGVLCRETPSENAWNTKWTVKKIGDSQVQISLAGVGSLQVEPDDNSGEKALFVNTAAGSTMTWSYQLATSDGQCIVNLISPYGQYVTHSTRNNPAWSVLRPEYQSAEIATTKAPFDDSYRILVIPQ